MTADRRSVLVGLLAVEGPDRTDTGAVLGRVRRVGVELGGVDGAGLTLLNPVGAGAGGGQAPQHVSDVLGRELEELQFALGEGPGLDAHAHGHPVLVADLAAETARWPWFAAGACELGIGAVFSFPLHLGAAHLGTLELHRVEPGPLAERQYADLLILAALATETLLDLTDRRVRHEHLRNGAGPRGPGPGAWLPGVHAVVHQASGMVSAALGVDVDRALLRIRAQAIRDDAAIGDVARRIVARRLRLDSDPSSVRPGLPGPAKGHPGEREP